MASNSFGTIFRITTWGESHGEAIGVVIDGCPAGIEITAQEINDELAKRAPGVSPYTSARNEADQAIILSGVFEHKTTGTPICIMIPNTNAISAHYEPIKDMLRPGHANFSYLQKYELFDYRGGGRASARETAARVAAGAIAKKILATHQITLSAYIKQIAHVVACPPLDDIDRLNHLTEQNPFYCPDIIVKEELELLFATVKSEGESLGGIVEFIAAGLPAGLGDPIYEKVESKLAHAMMSLPASKGFELGSGFHCVNLKGSEHNDLFITDNQFVKTATNHAGGVLGGITTGMPLIGRVAFKPTSSIKKVQKTLNTDHEEALFELPQGSRHDPCVAIRAVPVVKAMLALVLVDALLLNRCAKI